MLMLRLFSCKIQLKAIQKKVWIRIPIDRDQREKHSNPFIGKTYLIFMLYCFWPAMLKVLNTDKKKVPDRIRNSQDLIIVKGVNKVSQNRGYR